MPQVEAGHEEHGAVLVRLPQAVGPPPPHLLAPDSKGNNRDEGHQAPDAQLRPDHAESPFTRLPLVSIRPRVSFLVSFLATHFR
jgi:hypothetical protein